MKLFLQLVGIGIVILALLDIYLTVLFHRLGKRYYHAVERLSAEGVETVVDLEAGADLYVSLRRQW